MKNQLLPLMAVLTLLATTSVPAANTKQTIGQVTDAVTLTADVDFIITGTEPFATAGSVDIVNTEHAVVIFRDIKPSVVIKDFLANVYINGEQAQSDVNCQVKMYAQGAIVFPYGSDFKPLTVFSEPNFGGESVNEFGLENSGGFMNTLTAAKLNNRIRSFKLKRGYMVTFALGTGGWGYSRCLIGDQEDLEMAEMPANMDSRISSYRLFKWQNAQKKGLASDTGTGANSALNTSWCYTWSTGTNRYPDTECVPNHIYEDWPSPASCGGVTYSCHLKTNNEPGNSADDHPQDVETVLANWQNLMRTGLRLCSETSHDGSMSHLQEFIREIDARGWRCDVLDLHCYWASGTFNSLTWYSDYYGNGRPIWISEWIWGASWNNNGIFGAVSRDDWDKFSTENQKKCYDGTKPILDILNSNPRVERYAYWNSERNCSKIYKDGVLSTLGEYYAKMESGLGYRAELQKIPNVVYAAPTDLTGTYSKDNRTYAMKWNDNNGDMCDSIVLERRLPGETTFTRIATLQPKDKTNAAGASYSFTDTLTVSGVYTYRAGTYPIGQKTAKYSQVTTVAASYSEGDETIQYGTVSATNTDYVFSYFGMPFEDIPVVIFGPISYNNTSVPLCHHLNTLKKNFFKYRFFTWTLSANQTMSKEDQASYIAIAQGNGSLGGLRYEANQIDAGQMDENFFTNTYGKLKGDTAFIHFNQPFEPGDTPVVFVNVLTAREAYPLMWKVFDVTSDGFKIYLQREKGITSTFITENVHYLAVQRGTGCLSNGKRIDVGMAREAVGGIVARTVEFGSNLDNPMLWGEPQTARESKAAITRYVKLTPTSASIRRTIDTSESSTTSSAREDFGWMVISDGEIPERVLPARESDQRQPVKTEYYSLNGKRIHHPRNGLFIQRDIFADGTSRATKKKL